MIKARPDLKWIYQCCCTSVLTGSSPPGPGLSNTVLDLPFGEQVLKVDHLHHDINVLPDCWAEVVFDVALALQLKHHLLHGQTFAAHTAELVAQSVGHALQRVLDERFPLWCCSSHLSTSHMLKLTCTTVRHLIWQRGSIPHSQLCRATVSLN